jgi:hypothetical protein
VSAFFGMLNSAAMVLGYFVLTLWVMFVIWVGGVLVREARYDARKKRYEEQRFIQQYTYDAHDISDTYDTDVLELPILKDLTYEDVYNYRKDQGRDHA